MKSGKADKADWTLPWTLKILFKQWKLSETQALQLSGGPSWLKLESRVALLFSVDMASRQLFILDQERAYKWLKTSNAVFEGRSALEVMLEEDIEGMRRVLRYIESELYA